MTTCEAWPNACWMRRRSRAATYGASYGLSIRAKCSAWPRPITVAWLYSQPGKGWMRTRDFSFGVAVDDHALPGELRAMLERWIHEVSADNYAEDVSSKGVKAWAVRHEAGVQHQDVLVERLRRVDSREDCPQGTTSIRPGKHVEDIQAFDNQASMFPFVESRTKTLLLPLR